MQPDMEQLLRLARSPEGQQLMQLLQKKGPQVLSAAAAQAGAGDTAQAGLTLSPLLRDPEVKKILDALGENL